MPHRRPRKRGSFDSHFDELIVHFRDQPLPVREERPGERSPELQEKIDLHALLFQRAWRVED